MNLEKSMLLHLVVTYYCLNISHCILSSTCALGHVNLKVLRYINTVYKQIYEWIACRKKSKYFHISDGLPRSTSCISIPDSHTNPSVYLLINTKSDVLS